MMVRFAKWCTCGMMLGYAEWCFAFGKIKESLRDSILMRRRHEFYSLFFCLPQRHKWSTVNQKELLQFTATVLFLCKIIFFWRKTEISVFLFLEDGDILSSHRVCIVRILRKNHWIKIPDFQRDFYYKSY